MTDGPARSTPAPLLCAAELERLRGEADSDDKAAVASAAAAAARGDRVSPVCG